MKIPSVKIISLLFSAIILIGGLTFLVKSKNDIKPLSDASNINDSVVIPVSTELISSSTKLEQIDTDNDGLKDWEEGLWGTNPKVTDTDKDGTSDGKEVSLGRDPNKKGPNDKYIKTNTSNSTNEPKTETEVIAKEFFSRYMVARQAGLSNDPEIQQDIIDDITKYVFDNSDRVLKYNNKSIKNIVGSDTVYLKAYINSLASIYIKYANLYKNDPINVSESEIEENILIVLNKFAEIGKLYSDFEAEVYLLPVPKNISGLHIDLLNALNFSASNLTKISSSDKDPLKIFQSLAEHQEAESKRILIMKEIFNYSLSMGVTFTREEPGYIFVNF